jgi:hypothetical protein
MTIPGTGTGRITGGQDNEEKSSKIIQILKDLVENIENNSRNHTNP